MSGRQESQNKNLSYDLVVVGSGPGGYVAAIRAAQLGMKTAIIEKDTLGGVCLNWGCIPTKALLKSADVYRQLSHLDQYGLTAEGTGFDLEKIVARSRSVASQLNQGIQHLLKKNKVELIQGTAELTGDKQIQVSSDGTVQEVTAKNIILATGARAKSLPHVQFDGKSIWSAREAMTPDQLPESLLVIGSGAIGVEFASFYQTLGVKVIIAEVLDRILPNEDADVSKFMERSFKKQGMKIHTSARVESVDTSGEKVVAKVTLKNGKEDSITVDKVILAAGVAGNIENLGLENVGVTTEKGFVKTDPWGETNVAGIYAIGDVAGAPCLAHKASHEGVIAVEKIAGMDTHPLSKGNIPGCTYCHPQVASIGLTEAQAKEKGVKVRIGNFQLAANGKAIAIGENSGLVKTIFDESTGELLGAHMVGAEVTEMIQGFGIARTMQATEAEIMQTVFAHPTVSEGMHESVLDAFNQVIHQ